MPLLDSEAREALLANGRAQREARASGRELDPAPVAKLFTPDSGATWLLSEIDPEDTDLAFGLCDLGLGSPELGYVRISELERVRGRLGLPVERDLYFRARQPLSRYAEDARRLGRIHTEWV